MGFEKFRRVESGKLFEIPDKMRLVKIAAIGTDLRPRNKLSLMDFLQNFIEAYNSLIQFGSQTDIFFEEMNKLLA